MTQKQKQKTKPKQVMISRDAEVREEIKNLANQTEGSYITLAELLAEAYHQQYYIQWKYDDFADYANQELATGYRKSMMLIKIDDKIKALGINRRKAEKMGWTKLRELIKIMNADNMEELMEDAMKLSFREVIDKVKIHREQDMKGQSLPLTRTLKVVMGEDTGTVVEEALTMAKKILQTDSMAQALSTICMDWMQAQDSVPEALTLEHLVKYAERVYGVKLTIAGKKEVVAKKTPVAEPKVAAPAKVKKETVAKKEVPAKKADKKKEETKKPAETKKPEKSSKKNDDDSIDSLLGL